MDEFEIRDEDLGFLGTAARRSCDALRKKLSRRFPGPDTATATAMVLLIGVMDALDDIVEQEGTDLALEGLNSFLALMQQRYRLVAVQ